MGKGLSVGNSAQRRIGVVLSYTLLAVNMVVGIVLTPIIVGALGKREYGLYQTVASFANNLALLDFGIGTTITRYISKYKAIGDRDNENRVSITVLLMTAVLSVSAFLVGSGLNFLIPSMYSKTFSAAEIVRARTLFFILTANVSLTLFEHYFVGICTASEKFLFTNGGKIVKIVLRVSLITILVNIKQDAIIISLVDIAITVLFLIIDAVYIFLFMKVRFFKTRLEAALTKQIVFFGSTIFLQAFVNQANQNVDKVILGVMTAAEIVAVYSVAMQVFSIFNSLSTAISSVYLPHVTKRIHSGATPDEITGMISMPGRKQFMITGLALLGFIYVGRDFITLWMGKDYIEAWVIALIIMVPSLIEIVENVAVSVTLALGKNGIRTAIIALAAVFNIFATILFIKWFGYIGAPIATALSYLFGYIIAVNTFYAKCLKIKVFTVFKTVFSKTWICFLVTAVLSVPILFFEAGNYAVLLAKALYMIAIFGACMWFYGFTTAEKNDVKNIINKIIKFKR